MSKTITICDGIYAVGGPNLSRSEDAYVYLVDAKSCLVLIDAGVGYGNDKIEKNIRSLGSEPAQVWHIIATHCHIDHIGGLHLWRDKYGSKIIAHELDRAGIEGKNNELTAASMYGVDYRSCLIPSSLASIIRSVWERWNLRSFTPPATLLEASRFISIPLKAGFSSARIYTARSLPPGVLIWWSGGDR